MPAKHEISLLPKEEFEQKALGRFLIWALSVGRWIIVFTELIVICAFLSRFYFDRRIADLHEEIFQKQAIVKAMSGFENDFRFLAKRLEIIEKLVAQPTPDQVLRAIIPVVPGDVVLTSFSFDKGKVEIAATATSEQGLATFWRQLDDLDDFDNVRLEKMAKEEKQTGVSFEIVADFVEFTKEEKNAPKT